MAALILVSYALFITCFCNAAEQQNVERPESDQRLEVYDGVYVNLPRGNDTERVMSLELDLKKALGQDEEEGRKKKNKIMQRILPMFIMPFVIQSAIIPLALGMLKFMMVKSFLVGKLALALIMFNAFRNHNSFKGRDSEMASVHYGYHDNGMEEYGTYLNH